MKYECPVCGYVYDEDAEGVAWDSLPDDWECPICGASKAMFAAEQPADGDIVVAYVDGEFTIKFLDLKNRDNGYIMLRPANKKYPPIRIEATDNFQVWGVVVWTIKHWK